MSNGFSFKENMTDQFALSKLEFQELIAKQKVLEELNERINNALD